MTKKIVLIDHEKANWQLFRQAFDEIEIDVVCEFADNCSDAGGLLKDIRPDALFVQLDPDITDALEFVRGIKARRRFKNVPTVVYSSKMSYYNFLARGHGADFCMVSPSATDEIKKVVEDFWSWREEKQKVRLF